MSGKVTHTELLLSLVYVLIGAVIMLLLLTVWKMVPKQDLYISDIADMNVVQFEWKEPQRDKSVDGNSILIGDKWYAKGLGIHAVSEFSVVIPKGYTRFIADVGVDDEVAADSPASVEFLVIGDGTVLAQTPVIKADMPPYRIDVRIEGITQLTLRTTNGGDGSNSDHGDWGNARVVKE